MKTLPTGWEAAEQATKLRPKELYHFYFGVNHYRYTNFSENIVFGGETWEALPIERTEFTYDSDLNASETEVRGYALIQPMQKYVQLNPIAPVYIQILRLLDEVAGQYIVLFTGQIDSVAYNNASVSAKCKSLIHLLNIDLPRMHYQRTCNYSLFGAGCGLNMASYGVLGTISSISADGLTIVIPTASSKSDGWFAFGWLDSGGGQRMITAHTGTSLTLITPCSEFVAGQPATIYPGCDRTTNHCGTKFNNLVNFGGFPQIPTQNPVVDGLFADRIASPECGGGSGAP